MAQWTQDSIPLEAAATLDGLFRERVRRTPQAVAYRSFDKAGNAWLDFTWAHMAEQVARWQAAFARENLQAGDRVAVLLRNSPQWVGFDQAALASGLVVVPLYTDDRPDNVAYILEDCAARLLLVQDFAHWKRLQASVLALPGLQRVLIAQSAEQTGTDVRMRTVEDWLAAASATVVAHANTPQQLASIVYTSGTTGRPKGVMLSHHNMLWNAHAILALVDVYAEDVFLSLLPLSHTLERTTNYYMPMMAGATVAYCRSINQLADDLQALRPSVMICVPRVLERLHAKIVAQMSKRSRLERLLLSITVNSGWKKFEREQGRARFAPQAVLAPFLQARIANKLLAHLGGRMRVAISGGAALPPAVARFFVGLGLPVLQGYGLTESSPVLCVNTFANNDPVSVGVALPDVALRIGAQQELLARSPGVMLGYWNNHSATHERVDAEGWLHTGDQARIENNHVYLTGRIKDILVLSNGEKVPPADMEMAICADPLFEQALVLGEGQAYLGALIVLNGEHWQTLAVSLGLNHGDPASLTDKRALNAAGARVTQQLHAFPGYAKVRRLALLTEPWSIENGLLTPTLKVKRNNVLERYSVLAAGLFVEGPA
jgi:long-chain acyl-CoA synthetase